VCLTPWVRLAAGRDPGPVRHAVRAAVRRPGFAVAQKDLIPLVVLRVKPFLPRSMACRQANAIAKCDYFFTNNASEAV
jgi:hypothetical protein